MAILVTFLILTISVNYANVGDTLKITGTGDITEEDVKNHNPSTVKLIDIQYGPSTIKYRAFIPCTNLEYVSLPASITKIESLVFARLNNLKNLTIPSSLKSIAMEYTFYFTRKFEKFLIDPGNQYFNVYDDCLYDLYFNKIISVPYKKTSINFHPNITTIGTWSFMATQIHFVNIVDSISSIETMAFINAATKEIKFGEESKLTEIVNNCFWQVDLTHFVCPPKITKILKRGFMDCSIKNFTTMKNSNLMSLSASAFESCNKLELVVLPSTIIDINLDAFLHCTNLENITIDGESEHYQTYMDCLYTSDLSELLFIPPSKTEITVPPNTQHVSSGILQNSNIQTVIINDTNEYLKFDKGVLYSFNMTEVLAVLNNQQSFEIDSRAKTIVSSCFQGISTTSVTFGADSNLTEISGSCFKGTKLTKFRVPPNVTTIGSNSFEFALSLSSIFISKKVKSIEYRAFWMCSSLVTVEFESNHEISSFGQECFGGCNLTNFSIPNTVSFVSQLAFKGCKIKSLLIPKSVNRFMTQSLSEMTRVEAIDFEKGSTLGEFCDSLFSGNSMLRIVQIPGSVKTIASMCFKNCARLMVCQCIEPPTFTSINSEAFYGCESITQFIIPRSCTTVSVSAFIYCISLEMINSSLTNKFSTYEGALYDRNFSTLLIFPHGLKKAKIHPSTSAIGENAFANAPILESIEFPMDCQITEIGVQTFFRCISLESISLPQRIKKILTDSFSGCEKLSEVTFVSGDEENELEEIGAGVFKDCKQLSIVNLGSPSSLFSINDDTFKGCQLLNSFIIPPSVTSIGNSVFSGCSKLSNLTISPNLVKIGNSALEGTSISSIELPSLISSLGSNCFANCAELEYVLIRSCESIGTSCFSGCVKLCDVRYCGSSIMNDQSIFTGCESLHHIYVPVQHDHDSFGGKTTWKVMRSCGLLPTGEFTYSIDERNLSLSIFASFITHEYEHEFGKIN